jgi:hypothetical protein
MSTLQVANLHFESTGNNRIHFTGANTFTFVAGGANVMVYSNTSVNFPSGISETVYNLSGTALNPKNGTIQQTTLTANVTYTDSFGEGESMTLMINDGTGYFVTWPTMTWKGGIAPTLTTTGFNTVQLWKANTVLYGSIIGVF